MGCGSCGGGKGATRYQVVTASGDRLGPFATRSEAVVASARNPGSMIVEVQ